MKCLCPNCERESLFRGMCNYCYDAASQLVRSGVHTWDDLIQRGFATGVKPRGRKKVLTNEELVEILRIKFGTQQVPSREAYIEAIGGDVNVLSKKHREILDTVFPARS